jgi:uncharacterized protein (TIGR02594 family)
MKTVEIQKALASLGFKPGPLDGIWGRQTIAAVRAFQSKAGLDADGIVGPLTMAALFRETGTEAPKDTGLDQAQLVWFKEATRLLGTKEKPGAGSNPDIIDWAQEIGIAYDSDDIPWCGLFVGHCISSTLDRESIPTQFLGARAWDRFGIKTEPTPGAVMVFWRKSPQSGLGHVGFYAGEDNAAYRILGGNQSDSVSLAWVRKDRLVAARWPATVSPPVPQKVVVGRHEQLSWNEA